MAGILLAWKTFLSLRSRLDDGSVVLCSLTGIRQLLGREILSVVLFLFFEEEGSGKWENRYHSHPSNHLFLLPETLTLTLTANEKWVPLWRKMYAWNMEHNSRRKQKCMPFHYSLYIYFLTKHRKIHQRLIVYPSRWNFSYSFILANIFFILHSICVAVVFFLSCVVKLFHFRPFRLFHFFTFNANRKKKRKQNQI